MAIVMVKTLPMMVPTTSYSLYITTSFLDVSESLVVAASQVYESIDHYNEQCVFMIRRVETITDKNTVAAICADYATDIAAARATLEAYLVGQVPWYAGGTVVQSL